MYLQGMYMQGPRGAAWPALPLSAPPGSAQPLLHLAGPVFSIPLWQPQHGDGRRMQKGPQQWAQAWNRAFPGPLITLQVDAGLTGRAWRETLKRFLTNILATDLGLRSSQVLGIHKRPSILFVLPLSFLSFFFFFFVFLGPHPQHVEVPRQGMEL